MVGNDWHIADTGDFNGDRTSDILWRHDSGQLAIWDMNDGQQSGYHFLGFVGSDWALTETGDFNGDGHDRHPVAPHDRRGGGLGHRQWRAGRLPLPRPDVGNDWHVVDTDDFNGDRTTDILWQHDSGQLAIWDMNGGQQSGYHFLGFVDGDWASPTPATTTATATPTSCGATRPARWRSGTSTTASRPATTSSATSETTGTCRRCGLRFAG